MGKTSSIILLQSILIVAVVIFMKCEQCTNCHECKECYNSSAWQDDQLSLVTYTYLAMAVR